jgi:hypothetical protein
LKSRGIMLRNVHLWITYCCSVNFNKYSVDTFWNPQINNYFFALILMFYSSKISENSSVSSTFKIIFLYVLFAVALPHLSSWVLTVCKPHVFLEHTWFTYYIMHVYIIVTVFVNLSSIP